MSPFANASPRPKANAVTCGRCLPRSPIDTTSSPWRCHTDRIAGGNGASSRLRSRGAGMRVLDLATGTGDLAFAAAARGARVVGLDITYRMIELAQAQVPACLAEARWSRRRAKAGATVSGRRHARAAVSRGVVRHRHHRLRTAQRARPAAGDRRNSPRARRRAVRRSVARFQPAVNPIVRSAYLAVSDRRGRGARLDRCTAIRTPIAISRRRFVTILAPRPWRGCSRMRGFSRVRHYRVLGGLMAIHHAIRD